MYSSFFFSKSQSYPRNMCTTNDSLILIIKILLNIMMNKRLVIERQRVLQAVKQLNAPKFSSKHRTNNEQKILNTLQF